MAYLKRCLAPTLKRGDIVMMDSLPVHKVAGVREVIEAARLRFHMTGIRSNSPTGKTKAPDAAGAFALL
jgi:hypothetical protein